MQLTEIHIIKKTNKNWDSCDNLCKLSKNLYNQALYDFNKEYKENKRFIRYNEMEKMLKILSEKYNNYKLLTPSVSQQVLMLFDKNVKSYLKLINLWKRDKSKLHNCPKFLKYKPKNGKNITIIRGDKNVCKFRYGYIHFPKKLNLKPIKTINVKKQEDLVQIRIVPKLSCYNIEIIYEKLIEENNYKNKCAIDLGVNNLAVLTFDINKNPIIINGKPLKSMNKYYNKKKSKIQSELILKNEKYTSNKLKLLTEKRNRKIKDYLHKQTNKIVKKLKELKVKDVAIGHNKEW